MIRALLASERADLYAGFCPYCKGTRLVPGPRGAAAQNFYCADCGAGFNRLAPEYVERYGLQDKAPPFGELIQGPTRKPS